MVSYVTPTLYVVITRVLLISQRITFFTSRTKHIDVRHHFLNDHVVKKDIVLEYIDTNNQLADIFTKPLKEDVFVRLRRELGILSEAEI